MMYCVHCFNPFQLTLLLPVFCVVGGGVLNFDGITMYTYYTRANVEISFDDCVLVEFGGALGALLFYVSHPLYYHVSVND